MNFVHITLLAGSAFAVLPILLHWVGRREPKRITFPALRFVRETAVQSQRGWSIKRWLLLVLRILLILLVVLALASPRVHSAMHATYLSVGLLVLLAMLATAVALLAAARQATRTSWLAGGLAGILWLVSLGWGGWSLSHGAGPPSTSGTGPICAAIVLDTSPAMDYRAANASRFEVAKEMAGWLMDRLPTESQIAIVTSPQGQRLHQGRVSANRQLENVQLGGRVANIPACIRAAVELVRGSKLERREVYVLTDMSANAWSESETNSLRALLSPDSLDAPVLIQLIDVGISRRENWALTQLRLNEEVIPPRGSVEVTATVVASKEAPAKQMGVELLVEERDRLLPMIRNGEFVVPPRNVQERRTIELEPGGSEVVRFTLRDLEEGTTHASLRLTSIDPLAIDNELYFTVESMPGGKFLVVGSEAGRTANSAMVAGRMLAPDLQGVDIRDYNKLVDLELSDYDSILMIDPPPLTAALVDKIDAAVDSGKGLMLVMGKNHTDPAAWRDSATARLLPGRVERIWRRPISSSSPYYFIPRQASHPVWSIFEETGPDIPWNRYPVFKYWELAPLADDASVILSYASSGHPAMVEQSRGSGRILTVTTPMTDADSVDDPPWNYLFAATDPWPNFGLLHGSMRYLSRSGNTRRNFAIGMMPQLDNPIDRFPDRYDLFTPTGEMVRLQAQGNLIKYAYAHQPGNYHLRSAQLGRSYQRGFSVQLDDKTVDLTRIDEVMLDQLLGEGQYFLVRDRHELQSSLGQARRGKDMSPFLFTVVVLLVIAEQALSYRFYSIGKAAAR